MSVTLSNVIYSVLPGGSAIVSGVCTMDDSYATSGETMDLSAYLTGSPAVVVNGDDGYRLEHNHGTAAAGKVIAYNAAASAEVDNATNLAACVGLFIAMGNVAPT